MKKYDPLVETPNHQAIIKQILEDENPDWGMVDREWKRFKYYLKLDNNGVAALFAGKYKSGRSFEKSTAYKQMVTGIVRLLILSQG